jgi:hypothetical protein
MRDANINLLDPSAKTPAFIEYPQTAALKSESEGGANATTKATSRLHRTEAAEVAGVEAGLPDQAGSTAAFLVISAHTQAVAHAT